MQQRNKNLNWRLREQKNYVETFGQTKARKGEESSSKEPKKRRSSNDMIGFLREKNTQENEFRQQELDLKR